MRPGVAAAITAASALGTACFDIKPYKGQTLVNFIPDDTGGASVAPQDNITLHFASSGFHLPDQLQIDSVDVMGHATSPCWGESGTGFAVMPMPRVSGDPLDGGVTAGSDSHLQATMTGPVVVQLKTTWSTRWSFAAGSPCSTDMAHISSGSSTFTVFPDGHIVRHDVLAEANPNMEQLMPGRCTCAAMPKASDAFILSSYWAFNRALFPTQFGGGDSGGGGENGPEQLTLGNFYDVSSPETAVCFEGASDQYQIATVWRLPPGDGGAKPNAAAVGFDTVVSHDLQKPILAKLDFPWDVHGALFVERSNCTAALKHTLDYTAPQELTISSSLGTISKRSSELDGIYGGDPGEGGSPGIDVSDGTTTLSGGPLNGSFVVWLRFPRSVIVPTATRAGATPGWYAPQQINDREWLVWVQDALQPGETITVRPNY
jgi:hypothetical protein